MTMKFATKFACSALLLTLAIGVGTAAAQNPPSPSQTPPAAPAAPATPPAAAPAAQSPAPAPAMKMDKKSVSKSCTDQANAKGLHGKARKKFRADCKKAGGMM